jgi:hypothetical protein
MSGSRIAMGEQLRGGIFVPDTALEKLQEAKS